MSNKIKTRKRTHLTKKQEHKILQEVAPKIPKWKLKKFNKELIKGINRSSMTLNQFRNKYNSDKEFEDEVASVGNVLLESEFLLEDREAFYKDLELVFQEFKERA